MLTHLSAAVLAVALGLAAPLNAHTADLTSRLAEARRKSEAPAMAIGVIDENSQRHTAVSGERAAGTGVEVQPNDLWHIGSISKSFTAILAGRLVDQGKIRWDSTIIEVLPSFDTHISRMYHTVTLEQLLGSRGGIPAFDREIQGWLFTLDAPLRTQRRAATRRILSLKPIAPPGVKHVYSNFGYIVAAAMLEQAADSTWEDLIKEHIAGPLKMTTLGFGPPGDPRIDAPDQPWGHLVLPDRLTPIHPAGRSDNPPAYNPAGRIHASIDDLTSYAAACLGTLKVLHDPATTDDTLTPLGLRAVTARRIFQTPAGDGPPYALGFVVNTNAQGNPTTIWHNGSNTMWYAELLATIDKQGIGRAAIVCANATGPAIDKAVADLAIEFAKPAQPE